MKKLLKAPVGVQLSALFLLFLFLAFLVTAPWQLIAFIFCALFTAMCVYVVFDWLVKNRE